MLDKLGIPKLQGMHWLHVKVSVSTNFSILIYHLYSNTCTVQWENVWNPRLKSSNPKIKALRNLSSWNLPKNQYECAARLLDRIEYWHWVFGICLILRLFKIFKSMRKISPRTRLGMTNISLLIYLGIFIQSNRITDGQGS